MGERRVVYSGSKAYRFRYVHLLVHALGMKKGVRYQIKYWTGLWGIHFRSTEPLQPLALRDRWQTHRRGAFHPFFVGFREILTKLSLGRTASLFNVFVALVGYPQKFSVHLLLGSLILEPDEGPVPSPPLPLRGRYPFIGMAG